MLWLDEKKVNHSHGLGGTAGWVLVLDEIVGELGLEHEWEENSEWDEEWSGQREQVSIYKKWAIS